METLVYKREICQSKVYFFIFTQQILEAQSPAHSNAWKFTLNTKRLRPLLKLPTYALLEVDPKIPILVILAKLRSGCMSFALFVFPYLTNNLRIIVLSNSS